MDFQKGSYIRSEAQCGKELAGQPPSPYSFVLVRERNT